MQSNRFAEGGGSHKLIILAYHRVAEVVPDSLLNPRLISAIPMEFDRQMMHLASTYKVVSMETVLESISTHKPLPKNAVLITFDDAYYDFEDYAWPILKKHGLPVSIFVPTAYPSQREMVFWWDQLYSALIRTTKNHVMLASLGKLSLDTVNNRFSALKRLQNYIKVLPHIEAMAFVKDTCEEKLGQETLSYQSSMDWDQLRSLAKQGVTLGAHTRTHPLLTKLSLESARAEISGSYKDLKQEIGDILPVFAYPNGSYSNDIKGVMAEEGFSLAFAVLNKISNLVSADPLALGRINITRKTSFILFRLRLHDWFCNLDRLRRKIIQ